MIPRTYLFVPGNRADQFDKALASGADAVVLDLEDAVAATDKQHAREAVGLRLGTATPGEKARLVVRINDETTAWFDADLQMLRERRACTVMLPKSERPDAVAGVVRRCPDIDVLALIETARGVLNAEALAEATGVRRLVFGTLDFALDLNLSGDPIGLDYAASQLALASRAAGLPPPVAGVTPEIDNEPRVLADLARALAHGFGAKLCIHPKQVAAVHTALQPSPVELDWARRVVAAAGSNLGVVQLDGCMVDHPVLRRAQQLLARENR